MKTINPQSSIADIVRNDYRTSEVFKKYQINYCCSGGASLPDVCAAHKLNDSVLLEELQAATRNVYLPNNLNIEQWDIDFLINYLIHVHHAYVYATVPALEKTLESFTKGHKHKHPVFETLLPVYQKLAGHLLEGNQQQEDIFFPYIRQVNTAYKRKEAYGHILVRTLRKPLSHVSESHQSVEELLQELAHITNQYAFPEKACTNYQVIFHKLHALHNDIQQHHYLETQFLLPGAQRMEKHLLQ